MNTSLASKPVTDMSLVEISEHLERITKLIEDERVKERDARLVYDAVANAAEANISAIKKHAHELRTTHLKKVAAFDGLLGIDTAPSRPNLAQRSSTAPAGRRGRPGGGGGGGGKQNIQDAIFAVWDNPQFARDLGTDEIIEGLRANGFTSSANDRSLKSSINQNLAKLCRVEKVVRLRTDGTRISSRDTSSRAKKYIAAKLIAD